MNSHNIYRQAGKILILLTLAWFYYQCTTQKKHSKADQEVYKANDFTDSVFTAGIEGPAVGPDGLLYVVNYQREGTIGKVSANGKVNLFVTLPEGSVGNGIRFDQQNNIYIADYPMHNVLKIPAGSRHIMVFAHNDSMNQPNDLAIMGNGILFASDPNWADSTGQLWRVDRDGTLVLLEKNMGTTNGIEVSPDNKTLYVNESVQRNVWAFDLDENGEISNKHLFTDFPDFGMDGMRCDDQGNLYICRHGKGTVAILSPKGKLIHEVVLKGKKPSNIAFGGTDGKTCFVTLQDRGRVEKFRTEFPGRSWRLRNP